MGCCISSPTDVGSHHRLTAKVITLSGNLKEYYSSIKSSLVLGDTSVQPHPSAFICNSDDLYYDQPIPPLHPNDALVPGQIYFILPSEKLRKYMSGSDMAAMAARATYALQRAAEHRGKGNNKIRGVMPVSEMAEEARSEDSDDTEFSSDVNKMAGLQTSESTADRTGRSISGSKLSIVEEEEEEDNDDEDGEFSS